MTIEFIDLGAQQARIKTKIDSRIQAVLTHGNYIMGPEVCELEAGLAAFCGAKHALGCANGTDALALPLMAWGVGRGDAVFCPSFTFAATAEIVPWVQATPVFVDVLPDTYNMDPASLEAAIAGVKKDGKLKPKVVIAVVPGWAAGGGSVEDPVAVAARKAVKCLAQRIRLGNISCRSRCCVCI